MQNGPVGRHDPNQPTFLRTPCILTSAKEGDKRNRIAESRQEFRISPAGRSAAGESL